MENSLIDIIVTTLEDKKATDIKVVEISQKSILADYFVICSGSSTTQVKALADELDEKLETQGISIRRKEGYSTARWILMDIGEIVIHIFHKEERDYYNLERIWEEGFFTAK